MKYLRMKTTANLVTVLLLAAFAVNAGEVVSSACGGWFAVDSREIKNTTFEGGRIIVDETSLTLQSSPNAWGETGGGDNATITWESTSGTQGTIASATEANAVQWAPTGQTDNLTLSYVSGTVEKQAVFAVLYPYTATTDVPVPYTWLDEYFPGTADYEACALGMAANGQNRVWEAYLAGLNPTNELSFFLTSIEIVDGTPSISWTPNVPGRLYKVWGKTSLDGGHDWLRPASPNQHFFRVTVEQGSSAVGDVPGIIPEIPDITNRGQ